MLSRNHCTQQQLWAHHILDAVLAGVPVLEVAINRALWILGEIEVVQ